MDLGDAHIVFVSESCPKIKDRPFEHLDEVVEHIFRCWIHFVCSLDESPWPPPHSPPPARPELRMILSRFGSRNYQQGGSREAPNGRKSGGKPPHSKAHAL